MDILQAVLLGVLQGITEWLPISSSGHLAIAQQMMGLQVPVAFDVLLHMGTLAAVVVYYRKMLLEMLHAVLRLEFKEGPGRTALLVLAGSIPTAVIGFTFKEFFESMFSSLTLVGAALVLTGCVLFATRFFKGERKLGFVDAFIIGIAQGIAVAPGISRSGWTISTGMMRGVEKKEAADYSFVLAIPALVGATIFEGRNAAFSGLDAGAVLAGVTAAAIVGYASIALLLGLVKKGDFHLFAFYCWGVGALVVVLGLGFVYA